MAPVFDDAATMKHIEGLGRHDLVTCGVVTEVAVLLAAFMAVSLVHEVHMPVDACGGYSQRTEDAAFRRIESFGAATAAVATLGAVLQPDLGSKQGQDNDPADGHERLNRPDHRSQRSYPMKIQQLRNRTVVKGSDDDLAQFAAIVGQARDLPVYGGSIDVEQIRQSGLKFADGDLAYPVPGDMTREWIKAGGVRACWFRRGPVGAAGSVLYLHGGGYVGGCVEASRGIAAKLVDSLGAPVLAVEYRQGPEYPYPAAVDDAVEAYRWLADQNNAPIVIAGDSAGGALAIGVALEAARKGLRSARCAIAMSAWIDFSLIGCSWQANRDKDLVSVGLGQFFVDSYLVKTDPAVASVFFFERLELAPPLLVQMGDVGGPLDSTVAFVERARAAGVLVDLEVYCGMPHNFTKFRSPICDVAYSRMGLWAQGIGATAPGKRAADEV